MIYYTGVGSRETPLMVLQAMMMFGKYAAGQGWVLRSGGADGADSAFEAGACSVPGHKKEIYAPWEGFNRENRIDQNHEIVPKNLHLLWSDFAQKVHPSPRNCKEAARKLHGRNIAQVLGDYYRNGHMVASDFLICYTEGTGGTMTAYNTAKNLGIPIINFYEIQGLLANVYETPDKMFNYAKGEVNARVFNK